MNLTVSVNQKQLLDILLNVGLVRPVFIWGAPGIGKSAIVEQFAEDMGLPCVSLLGSQLAPEDIIGVPQIVDGRSVFCPPRMIAREEPYCLFLDELNASMIDLLLRLCPDDEDTIYQIVDLLVDTCSTKRKMLRIAGDDKPTEVVRSRLKKLNADHIRFVLDSLAENTAPVRNMKQYLLAMLYNAPTTMNLYYQNKTNHDFARGSPKAG